MRRESPILATLCCLALVAAGASAAEPEGASRVILRWKTIPDAAVYEVQIALDEAFAQVVVQRKVEATTFVWDDYPATPHFWRVRSVSADGRTSVWSPARTITAQLAAPQPTRPEPEARLLATAAETRVTFSWEACEVCVSYRLEIAREPSFATPLIALETTEREQQVRLPNLGRVHWRVIGVDPIGRRTPPSPVRVVTLGLPRPQLVAPVEAASIPWSEDLAVELSWQPHPLARRYLVEVSAGTERLLNTEVTEPRLIFRPQPGAFTWKVTALGGEGRRSETSVRRPLRVTLAVPALLEPPPEAQLDAVAPAALTFTWTAVPSANLYAIEVAADASFLSTVAQQTTSTTTLRLDGLPLGQLWWRVIAANDDPALTANSTPATFSLRGPASTQPLPLPPPGPVAEAETETPGALALAARLGWQTSFGALSSPHLGVEASWRTPFWPAWSVRLRLGWAREASEIPAPSPTLVPVESVAHLVPIALAAVLELPVADYALYGGAGLGAELVFLSLGPEARLSVTPAGLLTAGASRPLGPGALFAELDLTYANLDNRHARLRTTGLLVAAGYRVAP